MCEVSPHVFWDEYNLSGSVEPLETLVGEGVHRQTRQEQRLSGGVALRRVGVLLDGERGGGSELVGESGRQQLAVASSRSRFAGDGTGETGPPR